jgi:four helix bundle protein
MQDFRNLKVWQKAHAVVFDIYRCTADFPKHELYGVVSQLRRAAISVPNNIAEGSGRGSDPEFARFLLIANGSLSEVHYLLILSQDLQMMTQDNYDRLTMAIAEVGRMIQGCWQLSRNLKYEV